MTEKIRASRWTRSSTCQWDVEYAGHTFSAVKRGGTWELCYYSPQLEDWRTAVSAGHTAATPFYRHCLAWFKTEAVQEFVDQCGNEASEMIEDMIQGMAEDECPTCHASGAQPCRSASGKVLNNKCARHAVRAA